MTALWISPLPTPRSKWWGDDLLGDGSGGMVPGPATSRGQPVLLIGLGDLRDAIRTRCCGLRFGSARISTSWDGTWFSVPYSLGVNWTPGTVSAADVDLDGQLDLVLGTPTPRRERFPRNGIRHFSAGVCSPVYLAGDRVRLR